MEKFRTKTWNPAARALPRARPFFDPITEWLLPQSLSDDPFEVTLKGLATRLMDGGVPVARMSVGREILHPVIGLINMQWDRDSGQILSQQVARNQVNATRSVPNPFAELAAKGLTG